MVDHQEVKRFAKRVAEELETDEQDLPTMLRKYVQDRPFWRLFFTALSQADRERFESELFQVAMLGSHCGSKVVLAGIDKLMEEKYGINLSTH